MITTPRPHSTPVVRPPLRDGALLALALLLGVAVGGAAANGDRSLPRLLAAEGLPEGALARASFGVG